MFVLKGTAEIDAATVQRERRWTDRRNDHGPFDFIGDVHGCADELVELLGELGYEVAADRSTASHPAGRKAFFVGDLVDRGPDSVGVLRLVMGMVRDGNAACIPGNHENKLWRALNGARSRFPTASPRPSPNSTVSRRGSALRSRISSTASLASLCSMTAVVSLPMPAFPSGCTTGRLGWSAASRYTGRPTSSDFRFAIRGPTTTAARPSLYTATLRCPTRNGSTTRSV